jgi:hypothetical protein
MIVTVIVPVVTALAIQAYLMIKLTDQVSQLSTKISQTGGQQLESPNFPILAPRKPGCESNVIEKKRESL